MKKVKLVLVTLLVIVLANVHVGNWLLHCPFIFLRMFEFYETKITKASIIISRSNHAKLRIITMKDVVFCLLN